MTRIKEQLWVLCIALILLWVAWHIGHDLWGGLLFLRGLFG